MTLDEISGLEAEWVGRIPSSDPGCFDWQPYDVRGFLRLLRECVPFLPSNTFLDVGCGIGTKCLIAASMGLTVYGIDISTDYLEKALSIGIECELADARSWTEYDRFGLVYVNHPLNCGPGCDDEAQLEGLIQGLMAHGAVLLSVNYDLAPGCQAHSSSQPCTDACLHDDIGWHEIARDGAWNAAWVKP